MIRIKNCILACFLLLVLNANAKTLLYLKKDLLVYNHQTKLLLPFLSNGEAKLPLHLKLDLSQHPQSYLYFNSSSPISVYLNNSFFLESTKNTPVFIPVAQLGKEVALLSFWGEYNAPFVDSLALVSAPEVFVANKVEEANFTLPLLKTNFKSVFAILVLMGVALFTIVFNAYPKVFAQFFYLSNLFFNYKVDTGQLRFSFESHYIASVLVAAVFFALSFGSLFLYSGVSFVDGPRPNVVSVVFQIFLVLLLFYLLKYLMIQLVSWLFSVNKFANLHFKVFVEIALVWSVVQLFLALLYDSFAGDNTSIVLSVSAVTSLFFLTLTCLKTSVLINRATRISTLHLISYLCITEWLLYLVILKQYLNYFY